MKIAWFTPFSDKSAIGKYSRSIAHELKLTCEVDFWVPRDECLLSTDLKIFQFAAEEDLFDKLEKYDFIIYNLGDHFGFHRDIYEISRRHRGVVVLHDYMMHHFFYAYYLIHKKEPDAYIRDMNFYYGESGKSVANDLVQGRSIPEWETEIMRYPFFEKAIDGALGVVCHSLFLAKKVGNNMLSPVEMLRLPFYHDSSRTDIRLNKEIWRIPSDKILLVTVGHVNPNKRIDRIIEFLGKQKNLRDLVVYVSIGSYDHNPLFQNYTALIDKYELQNSVKFLGYQPDSVLHEFMASADIFINLRYPVMEGGSASLVEQMLYGKPIIVTNEGHYADLPDDCVVKIGMEQEETTFVNALKMLIDNEATRVEIGKRGKQFAIEECNVPQYCRAFIDYLSELKMWKPLLELTDKVAQEFSAMNVSREVGAVDVVANEIFKIFNKGTG